MPRSSHVAPFWVISPGLRASVGNPLQETVTHPKRSYRRALWEGMFCEAFRVERPFSGRI